MLPRINVVQCDEGSFMLLVNDTIISKSLYFDGVWENHTLNIAKLLLQGVANPWVLDIGANLGAFTVPIAKYIAPQNGVLTAFEPQRVVYYQLCGNIFLNRLDNCYAYNFALGETETEMDIPELDFNRANNIGAFSMKEEYRKRHVDMNLSQRQHRIKQIKLDNLTPPVDSLQLSIIKIDVEGWELFVLKNGQNFLAQHGYPPILFEAWHTEFSEEREALLTFLLQLDYQITRLGDMDYLAQHPTFPRRLQFQSQS